MLVVWNEVTDRTAGRIEAERARGEALSDVESVLWLPLRNCKADYRVATSVREVRCLNLGESDVILAMGSQAVERLRGWGVCPRGTVQSLRHRVLQRQGGSGPRVLVTYSPSIVHTQERLRQQIAWDAAVAWRLHETGTLRPSTGRYEWKDDLRTVLEGVESLYADTGRRVPLALDLEMMGFYQHYADRHILTSQWSFQSGHSVLVDHRLNDGSPCGIPTDELPQLVREQITTLLTSEKISLGMTNGKGDQQWIQAKWGIDCTNFAWDTLLIGGLLNENRHNSLSAQCQEYATDLGGYDEDFNRSYDKGALQNVPRFDKELTVYAGGDSDATLRVSEPLIKELKQDDSLLRYYVKLLHPAARAFEKIESRGIHVDVGKMGELKSELLEYIKDRTRDAMSMIPVAVKAKYADNLSLTRPRLLVDYLFTKNGLNLKPKADGFVEKDKWPEKGVFPEDKRPKTSVPDHLGEFRSHPVAGDFIRCLEDIGSARKTLSTYVSSESSGKGFLSHLRPGDKFHPAYGFVVGALFDNSGSAGTNTGRLSAKNPAWQTVPKHTVWAKKVRRCYPAPRGMLCWQLDFSQGELRVAACVAPETRMISAYRAGMDLHAITAAQVSGVNVKEFISWATSDDPGTRSRYAAARQKGKAGNFGLLFGMRPEGFTKYARKNYGVDLTIKQAEDFIAKWFEAWPGIGSYHKRIVKQARRDGFVRLPMGRVRHLPMLKSRNKSVSRKAELQAVNSPVQGTLNDINLYSILALESVFGPGKEDDFRVVGTIHDSTHGYVRETHAEQFMSDAVGAIGDQLHRIPEVFGWEPQVDFPVDAEIGPNLADMNALDVTR